MATTRRSQTTHPSRTDSGSGSAAPSLSQLLQSVHDTDRFYDVALLNLVCSSELHGGPSQPIEQYLQWLDDAAEKVRLATERNYFKFLDAPATFESSQARFCMVCLVTVLQRACGVHYNPKWKDLAPETPAPESFGIDSNDLFIHAIMEGVGGTCGSLPVLYVAIGRRLGYPLRLVKAARHLFLRWDDPDGKFWHYTERFNVEATGPGIHFLPDEHYRSWPHPVADQDVEAGIYLKSLSPAEELAEFVAARGFCLTANGRLREAIEAFAEASRLAPHNRYFAANHKSLHMHFKMRHCGNGFLNSPVQAFEQKPIAPFWVAGLSGHKVLVQIISPVINVIWPPPAVGISWVRKSIQAPNGLHVEAWLPVESGGSSMTPHWVKLPDGRLSLVHKPNADNWPKPRDVSSREQMGVGDTIGSVGIHGVGTMRSGSFSFDNQSQLSPHEQSYIAAQIQSTIDSIETGSDIRGLPMIPLLAIPSGPAAPRLRQAAIGRRSSVD